MSSLRLALKLSRESSSDTSSGSQAPISSFTDPDFPELKELSKNQRKKPKRHPSVSSLEDLQMNSPKKQRSESCASIIEGDISSSSSPIQLFPPTNIGEDPDKISQFAHNETSVEVEAEAETETELACEISSEAVATCDEPESNIQDDFSDEQKDNISDTLIESNIKNEDTHVVDDCQDMNTASEPVNDNRLSSSSMDLEEPKDEVVLNSKPKMKKKSRASDIVKPEDYTEDSEIARPRAAALMAKTKLSKSSQNRGKLDFKVEDDRDGDEKEKVIKTPSKGSGKNTSLASSNISEVPDKEDFTWVSCDRCNKWRKIPGSVDSSLLPEIWYCSMNIWNPSRNSCAAESEYVEDTSENSTTVKETTKEKESRRGLSGRQANNSRQMATPTGDRAGANGKLSGQKKGRTANQANMSMSKRYRDAYYSGDDSDSNSTPLVTNRSSARNNGVNNAALGANGLAASNVSSQIEKVNWVLCNMCGKWRKVPLSIDVDALPEEWYCSMNSWYPHMARCSVPQEEDEEADNTTALSNAVSVNATQPATGASSRRNSSRIHGANSTTTASGNNGDAANPPAPKTIISQWVQCERKNCKKWRKVPPNVDSSKFPDKWYCHFNFWDPDRANCDVPEDSDSEAEYDAAGRKVSRNGLVLANGKGSAQLSYRRIIYGPDGKVRPMYNEKNVNNAALFSYSTSLMTKNSNQSIDSEDVEEPYKKISYWNSSHYDERGNYFYTSTKRATTSQSSNGGNSSGLNGFVSKPVIMEHSNAYKHYLCNWDAFEMGRPIQDVDKPSSTVLKMGMEFPVQAPNHFIFNHFLAEIPSKSEDTPDFFMDSTLLNMKWPKKVNRVPPEVYSMTFGEKQQAMISIIKTILARDKNSSMKVDQLVDGIQKSTFTNPVMEYLKATLDETMLGDCIRVMEERGEVIITFSLNGLMNIAYHGDFSIPSSTIVPSHSWNRNYYATKLEMKLKKTLRS